jgi:hypothetical protein
MKMRVGKCGGPANIGPNSLQHGPVFSLAALQELPEEL